MLGEGTREEEPRGDNIVGLSGEAEKQGSGNAALQWSNSLATIG